MAKSALRLPRRVSFFSLLRDLFEPHRHLTLEAMIRFLVAFSSLEWLIHSLAPLLEHIGQSAFLGKEANLPEHWLEHDLSGIPVPLVLLVASVAWNWGAYLRNRESESASPVPEPHPGLILLLGIYKPQGRPGWQSSILDVAALEARLDRATPGIKDIGELRAEILKSNWGPMLVAIQHHASALKRCWILCTKDGSEVQFNAARKLVFFFVGREIRVDAVVLNNAFDIAACTLSMQRVFQNGIPDANLQPQEVIADITGGTAAMSSGIVVASWPEDRKIEYFRQDVELFNPQDGKVLTPDEIRDRPILVKLTVNPNPIQEAKTHP